MPRLGRTMGSWPGMGDLLLVMGVLLELFATSTTTQTRHKRAMQLAVTVARMRMRRDGSSM